MLQRITPGEGGWGRGGTSSWNDRVFWRTLGPTHCSVLSISFIAPFREFPPRSSKILYSNRRTTKGCLIGADPRSEKPTTALSGYLEFHLQERSYIKTLLRAFRCTLFFGSEISAEDSGGSLLNVIQEKRKRVVLIVDRSRSSPLLVGREARRNGAEAPGYRATRSKVHAITAGAYRNDR